MTLLEQAQQELETQLAALPAHRRHAVALVATTEGARIALVSRPDEHWLIEGHVGYQGQLEAGATVLFAWGHR